MFRDTAREMAECCRALYEQGLIAGADCNVAVRIGAERALVTPSGVLKSGLTPDDMVEVDMSGKRLSGHREPSIELDMHLRILRRRSDVGAVVHAHPPVSTGFGVAGLTLDDAVLPELTLQKASVPLVPYGTPGTEELGDAVEPYVANHDALILANHGALTFGAMLNDARIRMESLEHAAKIILTARLLGKVKPLEPNQVEHLELLRRSRDISEDSPGGQLGKTEA